MGVIKRLSPIITALILLITGGCFAGDNDTLVVGYEQFNGVFSPFFAVTDYDADVARLTGVTLLRSDPSGVPMGYASEYIPPKEITDSEGNIEKTVYTFKLVDSLKFSDGSVVTADDVIFSFKVLCDPSYNGLSNIAYLPIIGINEYKYDDANYEVVINELKKKSENITDDELYNYIATCAQTDYEELGEEAITEYLAFENTDNLKGDALRTAIIRAYSDYEFENSKDYYLPLAEDDKFRSLEREYTKNKLNNNEAQVNEIEGIKKIDERTVTVEIEGVSPVALWDFGSVCVVPSSYYAKGENNKVFKKGDLSVVLEKNGAPCGAGPYVFKSYKNNVVTFEANEYYFLGKPKIPIVKFQVTSSANKAEGVAKGELDISDPMATIETLEYVKEKGLHYSLVGHQGYGYIGINANRIKDINVRKGLMHLMNRVPAISSYYGELATVIERPLSKTSWAYPKDAKEVYAYNADDALACFVAAGYEQTKDGDKTILKKGDKQLYIQVGIGGEGIMDHPSAPILTQMKIELEKMGGILDIVDCDMNLLTENLDAGQWDMWAASWELTNDPDMHQKYHSEGASNYYAIHNDELDDLLEKARTTSDIEIRKGYYKNILDIVMEEAVEMPVYQRMNMYVYNKNNLDINTLPENTTTFYSFFNEIERLKLK